MLTTFLIIKKLLTVLNSNENPTHIAGSFALATLLAIMPFNGVVWMITAIFLLIGFGNIFVFLFSYPFFTLIDVNEPLHIIGTFFLTQVQAEPLFTFFYNLPLTLFLNWNNTVQFGGYVVLVVGLCPLTVVYRMLLRVFSTKIKPAYLSSPLSTVFKVPKWVIILFKD